MLKQSRTGKHYPWLELYERSLKFEEDPRMPAGNYIGPIRVVDKVEGRGIRGVIATSDFQVGELILAEKSFASGYPISSLSKDRDSRFGQQDSLCYNMFISRLIDDPTLIETLAPLHPGGKAEMAAFSADPGSQSFHADFRKPPTPVGGDFCLDIDSVDLMIAQTSQVATSCKSCRCFPVGLTKLLMSGSASLDRSCVFPVVRGPRDVFPPGPILVESEEECPKNLMPGVWPYLSLINHACFPNVTVPARFGDFTFVRAREFIPAGTEITMAGLKTVYEHDTRERLREKAIQSGEGDWGCRCCVDDKLDGASRLGHRKELFDTAGEAHVFENCGGYVDARFKRIRKFVIALEATYRPGYGLVRPELAQPLWELAGATFMQQPTMVAAGRLGAINIIHGLQHSHSTRFPLSPIITLFKRALVAMGCQMTLSCPVAEEIDPLREDARWSSNCKIQVQSLGISSDVTTHLCLCLHKFTTMQGDSHTDESLAWLQAAVGVEKLALVMRHL